MNGRVMLARKIVIGALGAWLLGAAGVSFYESRHLRESAEGAAALSLLETLPVPLVELLSLKSG